MKPYKHIKQTRKIVDDLKYELQYSKNKVKDAKRINAIIDCLNSFEALLEERYKVKEIDNLLCYIFKEEILKHEAEGNKEDFNLAGLVRKLDNHLQYNSQQNIRWLADDIKTYEISKNILNSNIEQVKKVPEEKEIVKLIKDLFMQFKTDMLWKK